MVSLRCNDYGFECEHVSDGDVKKVVYDFWQHMNKEHGIDYSQESIVNSVKRKNPDAFVTD